MSTSVTDHFSKEQQQKAAVSMYIRLCKHWMLDKGTAAKLILVDDNAWELMTDENWHGTLDQEQKVRIGALFQLYEALHRIFSEPMADNWVTTKNKGPLFKGKKPIQVMLDKGLPTIIASVDYIDGLLRR